MLSFIINIIEIDSNEQHFRSQECANPYFVLQRRRGHGTRGLCEDLVVFIN